MGLNEATLSSSMSMDPQYQKMMEQYISILEKTNQQLGVWSNPYGIAIGILSIFIAIIAMGVAFAIWRQSKEQKDRFNQFLADQEKIIQLKNKKLEQVELKLDGLIRGYEKQLKSATKNNKKEIKRAIADLKKEKASIGAYIGPMAALGTISGPSIANYNPSQGVSFMASTDSTICTNCGKRFSYSRGTDLLSSVISVGNKTVYCSYCGRPNIV